jgi:1,4-dihydroxy-6-naphthoate synthase
MPADIRPTLRIGHSPDPDDAFMWWPLTCPHGGSSPMDTGRFRFEPVLRDIETLNEASLRGELEITAMSCANYPRVADRYALTACGASVGDGYGPRLVARGLMALEDLRRREHCLAVPGTRTSAFAAASLLLGPGSFRFECVPFQRIIDSVAKGRYSAGLVIHEGQLTFEQAGLTLLADLGAWWCERTGLPLPLGVNAVRKDLEAIHGPGTLREIAATLEASVAFALSHREDALRYAMQFASEVQPALVDRFVGLYVNQHSLEFGPRAVEAVKRFLAEASIAGLAPPVPIIELVDGRVGSSVA